MPRIIKMTTLMCLSRREESLRLVAFGISLFFNESHRLQTLFFFFLNYKCTIMMYGFGCILCVLLLICLVSPSGQVVQLLNCLRYYIDLLFQVVLIES